MDAEMIEDEVRFKYTEELDSVIAVPPDSPTYTETTRQEVAPKRRRFRTTFIRYGSWRETLKFVIRPFLAVFFGVAGWDIAVKLMGLMK